MELVGGKKQEPIKLSYAQMRDPDFNPVLMKLVHTKMKYKIAKKTLKLLKAVKNEQTKGDEIWASLSEKHLEPMLGENGAMVGMRIKASFTDEEKKAADEALEEFGQTEVEIDKPRLTATDLMNLELTPAELMRIQPLLVDEDN